MHLHVCSDELSMLKKFEKKHIGYSNLNGKLNSYAHISHDLSCMMKIKPKIKPPLSRFNKKNTQFSSNSQEKERYQSQNKKKPKTEKSSQSLCGHHPIFKKIPYIHCHQSHWTTRHLTRNRWWLSLLKWLQIKRNSRVFPWLFAITLQSLWFIAKKKSDRRESSCEWHKSERIVERNCPIYREGV